VKTVSWCCLNLKLLKIEQDGTHTVRDDAGESHRHRRRQLTIYGESRPCTEESFLLSYPTPRIVFRDTKRV